MAAAEARAAWQRTTNRCFVQEDARRAPKFASSSILQNDSINSNATHGQEEPTNFVPLNWNTMNSNLPPDTKWWLHLQSNFGYQQDFTFEQLSVIGHDLKEKIDESTDLTNSDIEAMADEIKVIKKNYESDPPWMASDKCEPWWRITDQEELASFVAQKSVEQVENCDLPRPSQTVNCSRNPNGCVDILDCNKRFISSTSLKLQSGTVSTDEYWFSSDRSYLLSSSDEKLFRSDRDSSRAELLEALCHSQTRARKAEIAAEKAYNEKEHIIKLFFRQASHLFAYKQWLHMLQLENLYLQFKLKEQHISTLFPNLPWTLLNKKETKGKEKKRKKKRGFCKYIVACAVGLGLAGAGLLLGWTFGWLFPYL